MIATLNALLITLMLTATMALAATAQQFTSDNEKALVHTVFFWFHDGVSEADSQNFYEELKKLQQIPQIRHGWIGVPADTEERGVIDASYDYSITFVFEDEKAEGEYQVHPIHTEFVETNSHLWEKVTVYDAITP